jgi:hypothetical protein
MSFFCLAYYLSKTINLKLNLNNLLDLNEEYSFKKWIFISEKVEISSIESWFIWAIRELKKDIRFQLIIIYDIVNQSLTFGHYWVFKVCSVIIKSLCGVYLHNFFLL